MSISTNIAIIGAGPAGATLAHLLAKKKIPHILIDKASFPRDKVCGDAFTAEVLRVLREIDESLFEEFINADWTEASNGWYMELGNGKNLMFDCSSELSKSGLFYTAKRKIFDNWFISKLNSNYTKSYLDCEVKSVERKNNRIILSCEQNKSQFVIDTNLVIGADGERSIVKKSLDPKGIKKVRNHHAAVIRSYYKNVTPKFKNKQLELYFSKTKYPSYFWIFPLPNGEVNVGLGALSSDVSMRKINLKKDFEKFISNHPTLAKRFENSIQLEKPKGWGIPLNSDAFNFTGDNYILIGDSAKFGEPLTGKGIGVAMQGSSFAVPIIEEALNKNNFSNNILNKYEQLIQTKFRKEWDSLTFWQQRINRWYVSVLFKIASISKIKKFIEKKYSKGFNKFVFKKFK
jgi:geranylgeranyl reductase family protein